MKTRVILEIEVENLSSGEAAWVVQDRIARFLEVASVCVISSDELPEPRESILRKVGR